MGDQPDWYLPDPKGGLEPVGPFTAEMIRKKMEAGQLRLDSYIWGSHFDERAWKRIFEVPEFQEQLSRYPRLPTPRKRSKGLAKQRSKPNAKIKSKGHLGKRNHFRRFPRVPIEIEVIMHDGKNIYRGTTLDISEKGAFIRVPPQLELEPGLELMVILRGVPEVGTFSASSVVMRTPREEEYLGVGLYFLRLNPLVRRKLALMILQQLSETTSPTGVEAA